MSPFIGDSNTPSAMSSQSRSQIIQSNPIGKGLDGFRIDFKSKCENAGIPISSYALHQVGYQDAKRLLVTLVSALLRLPATEILQSRHGDETLFDDLLSLNAAVRSVDFNVKWIRPLLDAILESQPDEVIWHRVYDAINDSVNNAITDSANDAVTDSANNAVAESTPPRSAAPLCDQTPMTINSGSFVNTNEHRKYVDGVLKEEMGDMYVNIEGFFEAFVQVTENQKKVAETVLDKCKEGDSPLYRVESGWKDWPKDAKETDVVNWFGPIVNKLLDFAKGHLPVPQSRRRLLAPPPKPLQGSTADRKLDVGFVDDSKVSADSECHWSDILIPGELKSNPSADVASKARLDLARYAREVLAAQDSRRFVIGFTLCGSFMRLWEFDRLGGIASEEFDINEDGLQFVSAMLGFLWMNEEQLGFDPTIVTVGDKRYIEIERKRGKKERLVIDKVIKRVRCVAGRATTCWKVYEETNPSKPLVVKDSWQYPEREEEGKLLREAKTKGVENVARYFHHETVCVGDRVDDVFKNIRKGLDVTKTTKCTPKGQTPLRSMAERRASLQDGGSSNAGRKRSSNCTNAPLPPSKRTCSSSSTKRTVVNRVHRRVVVSDYGKAIYKASTPVRLLAAFEHCIDGYESLHRKAGMLQRDISLNNLMVNEDDENLSWPAFLIDLDLAIREERVNSSGARRKTGTRAFMAIGILHANEQHSFMHDLESFFWVLFWICIHFDGQHARVVPRFDRWNYAETAELATLKIGIISYDGVFQNTVEKHFTEYYRPLIGCVDKLRRAVFPDGKMRMNSDTELYSEMKKILRDAKNALEEGKD